MKIPSQPRSTCSATASTQSAIAFSLIAPDASDAGTPTQGTTSAP
jgi:hypothetical protein